MNSRVKKRFDRTDRLKPYLELLFPSMERILTDVDINSFSPEERHELCSVASVILNNISTMQQFEDAMHVQVLIDAVREASNKYKEISVFNAIETFIGLLQLKSNLSAGSVKANYEKFTIGKEIESLCQVVIAKIDEIDESQLTQLIDAIDRSGYFNMNIINAIRETTVKRAKILTPNQNKEASKIAQ